MASPVFVSVENPQAVSDTVSGLIPRALKARANAAPVPLLALAKQDDFRSHDQEEKERDRIAVSIWPASKLSPLSSAVTVTMAGLNSMRSMA